MSTTLTIPLKPWAGDLLMCPSCSGAVAESRTSPAALQCAACGASFPCQRGIPRFVGGDGYVGNFSFEWQVHSRTQLDSSASDESERTFMLKTGLQPADVEGKTILDVGCGMGRFSDVVSRWGGRVVATDLSFAVESAQRNIGDRPNVQVIQANLFELPLKDEAFDLVFSLGVLHHTPSCREAFLALPRLVKPGGQLAVWVYYRSGAPAQRFSDLYRRITTRMPRKALYELSRVAVPLYHVHRAPLIGKLSTQVLPTSMHPRPEWRVLDTFDWYSPRYQSKHTYPEVFSWFQTAGFVDMQLLEFPVSIRGRKPLGR